MGKLDKIKEKRKDAANAMWEKKKETMQNDANAMQMQSNSMQSKPTKPTKPIKEKESKKEYAELVLLSENEYSKLTDKYGEIAVKRMIEILDNYKGANGKKYTSDYKAILNWVVERYEKEQFTKGDKKSKVNDLKSEYGEFL
jgi:hypothetical protein